MHVDDILRTDFEDKLADRFQERKAFNVSGGAADFGDDNVVFALVGQFANPILNDVGNVRNDLHGFAEIIAAPLF